MGVGEWTGSGDCGLECGESMNVVALLRSCPIEAKDVWIVTFTWMFSPQEASLIGCNIDSFHCLGQIIATLYLLSTNSEISTT